jgi:hypothetical protein
MLAHLIGGGGGWGGCLLEPNSTKESESSFLSITLCAAKYPEANFLVPDWEDIAGIGLSYMPARLHRMTGRYDNHMPESAISPQSGLKICLQ